MRDDAGALVTPEEALRALDAALDQVARGHGSCLLLVGPRGTRKRALLQEARTRAKKRRKALVRGIATCGQAENPYGPFAKLGGYRYSGERGVMPKHWYDHLESPAVGGLLGCVLGAAIGPWAPMAGGLLGFAYGPKVIQELFRSEGLSPSVTAMVDVLLGSVGKRPLLALLDDAHFTGEVGAGILSLLHVRAAASRFLLVATWDEQYCPVPPGVPACFLAVTGAHEVTAERAREAVQHLKATNQAGYRLLECVSLRPTDLSRELAQQDPLRDATNCTPAQVDSFLRSWRAQGLLAWDRAGSFDAVAAVAEAVVRDIDDTAFRQYQVAWAEALKAVDRLSHRSYAPLIADCFSRAGDPEEELEWRREASQRHLAKLSFADAATELRLALKAWEVLPPERRDLGIKAQLCLELAHALGHTGELDDSLLQLGAAEEAAQTCRDPELRAETTYRTGLLRCLLGDSDKGMELLHDAERLYERRNEPERLAQVHLHLGVAHSDAGRVQEAEQELHKVLQIPEDELRRDKRACAHLELGRLYAREGHRRKELLTQAELHLKQAEQLLGETDAPLERARLHCYYARLYGWENAPEALDQAEKALALCRGVDLHLEGEIRNVMVEVLSRQGRWREGEEHYRRAVEVFERVGNPRELAKAHSTWARLNHRLWNAMQSLPAYRANIEVTKRMKPVQWHHVTQNLNLIADLQRWQGDLKAAESTLGESEKAVGKVAEPDGRSVCRAALHLCRVEWLLAHEPLNPGLLKQAQQRAARAQRTVPYHETIMHLRRTYCRLDRLGGNLNRAETRLRELLESDRGQEEREVYELALDAWELALVCRAKDDETEARRWFGQARGWAKEVGNTKMAKRIGASRAEGA